MGVTSPRDSNLSLDRTTAGGYDTEALLPLSPDVEDNAQTRESTEQGFWRAACWTICSATALYTTKILMTSHGYHYPYMIAFRASAATFFTYIVTYRWTTETLNMPGAKRLRWGFRLPEGDDFLLNSKWLYMVPASLAAAASFPMLLQGLLHMPSLPVIAMLFPIIYAAESLLLSICCSPSRSRKWLPFEVILIVAALSSVLYNEYCLMVPGLIWGLNGVVLIGVSRAFFAMGSERCGTDLTVDARLNTYHGFVVMTLVFDMLSSGFLTFYHENVNSIYPLSSHTLALMVVNMVSFIGTSFSGTSILAYSPISFESPKPQFSNIPIQLSEAFISFGASILVFLLAIRSKPMPYVCWVQIMAFLLAAVSTIGIRQIHNYTIHGVDNTQLRVTKSFRMEPMETRKPGRIFTISLVFLVGFFFSGTLSFLASNSINSLSAGQTSSFDLAYKPESRFEIVVSMFQEEPSEVKSMLDKIKATTLLSTLKLQVIIYTKNPNQDLATLKNETGADIVERLDNLGREGGTYLHHIVNKWDTLAQQTMFIQAHAHNMREIVPRINNYLIPATGMLSLGFTGMTCKCNTCGDRWGWEDSFTAVPVLYEKIYLEPCTENTSILLAYKGQFVASAARIRGIPKNIYAGLLKTIRSTEGWGHNQTIIEEMPSGVTGEDTPDNPYFGFTMERIWGLLLQCGTDERIAAKCPSLLSGTVGSGEVGDCQCLDPRGS